ncbi:MAG: DUF4118 domain-containing protein [Magnetococcales bacterium]|nr:DUF4118 domain-containing protein [Magnetococcales bacterium]
MMPASTLLAWISVIALVAVRIKEEFWALALVGLVTLALIPVRGHLILANTLMIYLLLVFLVAVKLGRRASVFALFLSIFAFVYYFVPPYSLVAVIDPQYLLVLGFMLPIVLITAHLTSGLRTQVIIAESRERRIRSLYELASELTGIVAPAQLAGPCYRFIAANFDADGTILIPDDRGNLVPVAPPGPPAAGLTSSPLAINQSVAEKAFRQGDIPWQESVPHRCETSMYIPLHGSTGVHGVLVLTLHKPDWELSSEQESLLKTCVTFIGLVLERLGFAARAQQAVLEIESERLRNALLASLSHDMRTPVAAMAGIADAMLLSSPPLHSVHRSLLESMHKQIRLILSDIDKLLDMARLHTDHVTLHKEWQLLEEVIGSAIKTIATVLEGYAVHITIDDQIPLLEMDAMMMERVFCNLLENATRHTPVGSRIDIDARVEHRLVVVRVTDNGPGLPPGQEEAMFEKFIHGKTKTGTGGVGLGLSIVRAVVEAHGGTIHAGNRPEGGAQFEFSLPIGDPPLVVSDGEKFL